MEVFSAFSLPAIDDLREWDEIPTPEMEIVNKVKMSSSNKNKPTNITTLNTNTQHQQHPNVNTQYPHQQTTHLEELCFSFITFCSPGLL